MLTLFLLQIQSSCTMFSMHSSSNWSVWNGNLENSVVSFDGQISTENSIKIIWQCTIHVSRIRKFSLKLYIVHKFINEFFTGSDSYFSVYHETWYSLHTCNSFDVLWIFTVISYHTWNINNYFHLKFLSIVLAKMQIFLKELHQ